VPGWNPIVYLNEKNMELEVGFDVYDVPAPKKQVPGWNLIVYLNEQKMDSEVGMDVYDGAAPKKTGAWLESNCVP
jgi:hypothetical protein